MLLLLLSPKLGGDGGDDAGDDESDENDRDVADHDEDVCIKSRHLGLSLLKKKTPCRRPTSFWLCFPEEVVRQQKKKKRARELAAAKPRAEKNKMKKVNNNNNSDWSQQPSFFALRN